MTKINWKVRAKNPIFWVNIVLSVLGPTLTYMGLKIQDLTSWQAVGDVLLTGISNPYVLGLTAWGVYTTIVDPTSTGITDSARALGYSTPNSIKY